MDATRQISLQHRLFGSLGFIGRLATGLVAARISRYLVADLSLLAVMVSTGLSCHFGGFVRRLFAVLNRVSGYALMVIRVNDRLRQRDYRGCSAGLEYLNRRESL